MDDYVVLPVFLYFKWFNAGSNIVCKRLNDLTVVQYIGMI